MADNTSDTEKRSGTSKQDLTLVLGIVIGLAIPPLGKALGTVVAIVILAVTG